MDEINKRLTEVEYILKKLDDKYINKIPREVWNFISDNKDNSYVFNYDESKTLDEQNLNIDTVAILTYINMEYLLNEEQKKSMQVLLKKDEMIAEEEKRKIYNVNNLFKNEIVVSPSKEESMVEYNESILRKVWNKILKFLHMKN